MKKLIIVCVALGALVALSASAFANTVGPKQGNMELAWGTCKVSGGTSDVVFPCGSADGSPKATLHGSFSGAAAQPNFVAMDGQLDLRTAAALPDFFKISTAVEPANCNPGVVFGDERPATCVGAGNLCGAFPAGGQCDIAFGALTTTSDPLIAANRTKMIFSVFRTSTIAVAAASDFFVFKLEFYADLATESGGPCAGCSDQAAIVFNRLGLLAPATPTNVDQELLTPDCATWNGGTSLCGVTATQNKTWGALKSLYR